VADTRYMTCSNTAFQTGTAARSPVADANDCIIVRANGPPNTRSQRTLCAPQAGSASDRLSHPPQHSSAVLRAVKDASRCCAVPYEPP
jgi:hypothetical protein